MTLPLQSICSLYFTSPQVIKANNRASRGICREARKRLHLTSIADDVRSFMDLTGQQRKTLSHCTSPKKCGMKSIFAGLRGEEDVRVVREVRLR
jgi:hypothetical protein